MASTQRILGFETITAVSGQILRASDAKAEFDFDVWCKDNEIARDQTMNSEAVYQFATAFSSPHAERVCVLHALEQSVPDIRIKQDLEEVCGASESIAADVITFIEAHDGSEGSFVWYMAGVSIQYLVKDGRKVLRSFDISNSSSWGTLTIVIGPALVPDRS
jgi:hypothetical protein